MDFLKAILLAIIEGITEFLPISSTGHLILVENVLKLGASADFTATFLIVIQFPAILAVVVYFWKQLWPFQRGNDPRAVLRLWVVTCIAFLPAAVLGFLLDDLIEAWLFNPLTVALALAIGGIVLILVERRNHRGHFSDVNELPIIVALAIGFIQCLAMIPGTSRSAATIIGALLLGLSRPAAAEFSFFLAVPTMVGATALKLLKTGMTFSTHEWLLLASGCLVSFLSAYGVVAFLMHFIQRHRFTIFGYYRILLGVLVLLLLSL